MHLTRYTDYGFRMLIYLALKEQGQLSSIDEISDVYEISRNNVNKIVHQLGKAGIIKTKRGKGGGFCLAKKPEELNLGELVELMENSLNIVDCAKPPCLISSACRLKQVFSEATNAFISTLKNYTLADILLEKDQTLIQVLHLEESETGA